MRRRTVGFSKKRYDFGFKIRPPFTRWESNIGCLVPQYLSVILFVVRM
jgi:hypothetical protein